VAYRGVRWGLEPPLVRERPEKNSNNDFRCYERINYTTWLERQVTTTRASRCIGMQLFLNSSEFLTISCFRENFLMISQTVQVSLRWQTDTPKHPQTDTADNNTTYAAAVAAQVVQVPFTPNWGSLQRSSRLAVWRGGSSLLLPHENPILDPAFQIFGPSSVAATASTPATHWLLDKFSKTILPSLHRDSHYLIRLTSPISDNWRLSKIDQKRERLRIIQPATLRPASQLLKKPNPTIF